MANDSASQVRVVAALPADDGGWCRSRWCAGVRSNRGRSESHVLIDEYRVPVGVDCDETGRSGRILIRLAGQFHALLFEAPLEFAHIDVVVERLSIAIPAGIECEHILLEHSLEEPDHASGAFHDEPVLRGVTAEHLESEFFVEDPLCLDILDRQANGERA